MLIPRDLWQPSMALVDFTNPQACDWYAGLVAKLLDTGVDTIKTDFGERVPHLGVKWHDNSDPWKMHKWVMSHVVDQSGLRKNNTPTWTPADNSRSYYTQLYNDVVFKTIQKTHGASEAALFARSATAGGQRFPVHWRRRFGAGSRSPRRASLFGRTTLAVSRGILPRRSSADGSRLGCSRLT
jgi:alpha-glucosidase (family GH31 glycosyl hydrolase)